ncbi:MAG: hypothetical protein SW127_10985 [Actinomycetota bacterium]|nr:hypothetical protein [Actinomycetota bacterium]
MFSFTDHDADDTVLSAPLNGVAEEMAYTDGVRDMLRLSRQSEARAVLGAGMIGDRAYNDRMNGQGPHATSRSHTKADKHAIGELAKSAQIAPNGDLRERINEIIDQALGPRPNLDTDDHPDSPDDAVADEAPEDPAQAPIDFEDIALELAYRPTPDTVLRDELDSALISLDPDAHAHAREDVAQAFQNVTFAKEAFGHMEMSACLSAEHAIHLQHRIADLLDERVCRRDPRRVGHRRAIALAEIHGVPDVRLECECGYDTCTARTRTPAAAEPTGHDIPEPDTTIVEPPAAQSDTTDTVPQQTPDDEPGDGSESTPRTARCDAPTPEEGVSSDACPDNNGSAHSPTEDDTLGHHHVGEREVDRESPAVRERRPRDGKQPPVDREQHPVNRKQRPRDRERRPVDVRRVRCIDATPAAPPALPAPAVLEPRCAATPRVHRIVRYRDYRCRHP